MIPQITKLFIKKTKKVVIITLNYLIDSKDGANLMLV